MFSMIVAGPMPAAAQCLSAVMMLLIFEIGNAKNVKLPKGAVRVDGTGHVGTTVTVALPVSQRAAAAA